jgi:hypothetical protein
MFRQSRSTGIGVVSWGGTEMRAIKVLFVTVVMASSVVAGAAVVSPASADSPNASRWCC